MRAWTLSEAVTYGRGTERTFLCPEHGDSRPSASLNMIKKKWYCFTCGAHGSLYGDALLMEPDYAVLRDHLCAQMEAAARVYPESWLSRYDAGPVHPYWLDRFDEPTARRFRLGYDAESDAVTYPFRDIGGQVRGVVRRPLARSDGPKYLYPRGLDVSRHLFNYDGRGTRVVVLVEGAMDAVALSMVGVTAWAIYGARLAAAQVALIDRVDPLHVVTAFDNDDAGVAAHLLAKRSFPHRSVSALTWPRSWGKDVDEIGLERRKRVVSDLHSVLSSVECDPCPPINPPRSPSTSLRSGSTRRLSIV